MQKKLFDFSRGYSVVQNYFGRLRKPIVAVIKIDDVINCERYTCLPSISSSHLPCDRAYKFNKSLKNVPKRRVKCLALVINSAGGSPSQCHHIVQRLKYYSANSKVPVYTFAEEAATSGGFYILAAGDKIFADKTSLLGGVGAVAQLTSLKQLADDWSVTMLKATSDSK